MKVAVVADTHFGVRGESPILADAMSSFFREVFFPECARRGVKTVFHLGDLFDRRKYVNFLTAQKCWEDFIEPSAAAGMTVHLVIGNHDTYYRNTNRVNSPTILYSVPTPHVTVYDKPAEVYAGTGSVLLVPWVCAENEAETDSAVSSSKSKIVMGHLELEGFDMHRGQPCTRGRDPRQFDKFPTVLSGHFHARSKKGNVEYVGSAGQYTWADYGDERGFHFLDTDTHELEFVRNPFDPFTKIHYDDSAGDAERVIRDIENADLSRKFVKMVVREKRDLYLFDRAVDAIERAGVVDLQVVEDHRKADSVPVADAVGDTEDTLTELLRYIDDTVDLSVTPPGVLEASKVMARELYEEASRK